MSENFSKKRRMYIVGLIVSSVFFVLCGIIYLLAVVTFIQLDDRLIKADFILLCISGVILTVFLILFIVLKLKMRSAKPKKV
ncbi:MAG: hypothetical protein HZR80_02690 [Candidatus Heimdallarchaeota archaeon]